MIVEYVPLEFIESKFIFNLNTQKLDLKIMTTNLIFNKKKYKNLKVIGSCEPRMNQNVRKKNIDIFYFY
jgi:hypothetical protein